MITQPEALQKCTYNESDNGFHMGCKQGDGEWSTFTIMQFTGLYDKHGRAIFEGDILEDILVLPVTVDDNHGYRLMWGKDQLCRANAHNGVVLGNIYQNPGLLLDKQGIQAPAEKHKAEKPAMEQLADDVEQAISGLLQKHLEKSKHQKRSKSLYAAAILDGIMRSLR